MLNVALLGFGRIGQMHAENINNHRSLRLLYVYEKEKKLSIKAKKKIKQNAKINDIIVRITARGGSKRLPNKNMKLLNGKPLIFWTFNAVKKAYKNARIFISTDSEKIADFSKKTNK